LARLADLSKECAARPLMAIQMVERKRIRRRIAYFSMEIGLDPAIPTYSGGLGMLAGDTVRSAADLGIPMVAVALLHRRGYFFQRLDASGWQREEPALWVIEDFFEPLAERVTVSIEGRPVQLRAWRRDVIGHSNYNVPVILLDSDLPENSEYDRTLTHYLYGGDGRYRLCQEAILGIGGLRMLRALGYEHIERFHMNEGHAALLALELLDDQMKTADRGSARAEDIDAVRQQCVFTTHTPVPAGHDKFPLDQVRHVLGEKPALQHRELYESDGALNMTFLALNLSRYVNGVAKRHADVASQMFAPYTVDAITNGVHAATWTSKPFADLFDRYIPDWPKDSFSLRYAEAIPRTEIWHAHEKAKSRLVYYVNRNANAGMDEDVFTIGFARRAATYKRAGLLFSDIERLKRIAAKAGAFQIVYAGKAHPHDTQAKELIQGVYRAREELNSVIRVTYVENYDMELGQLLTSGVDLWLNNPQPPLEASGTSGMKAALNGIPSLSTLDGWWIEGCIEGVTGWAIGDDRRGAHVERNDAKDAESLYSKLESVILPMYYNDRQRFMEIMAQCISINGSFFNTERMMHEYVLKAYFR
jgi:starch phosphorylase